MSAFDLAVPVGPTSGGKIYAYNNLNTTAQPVAPQNTNRRTITFHNPGSVNVIVFPALVQALNAVPTSTNGQPNISNVTLSPTTTTLGGGFLVYANGGQITFTGECSGAWQALAATGSNNALTVSDNNV